MKKIICYSLILLLVITLSLFINIKTSDKIEVHASGPKLFEVNDVLPATTQLRIHFNGGVTAILKGMFGLKSDNNNFEFITEYDDQIFGFHDGEIYIDIWDNDEEIWIPPFNGTTHNYMDIDTSTWSLSKRTISNVGDCPFTWEDLAPTPSGYTITFNSNGGTTIPDIEEATELPNPLPTPTKSGYTFLGWYYDSVFTQIATAGDTIESNVTLYAKWQLNTYTITFNSNGGSSVPSVSDVTTLPDPLPTTTKSGYTFRGWYYDSDFTNEAFAGDPLSSNVTLYAKWQKNYRIFYNTNGGNTIPSISTDIIPDNLPIPVRNNDIFIGWYYDESLSDPVETNDILSSNITLYASWIDYDGIIEYFNDIYKDGFDDGYDDTFNDAYNQGYDLGFPYGYAYGYDDGYRDGLMEDHPIEFSEFFDKGFFDARDKYGKQIDDYQWESAQIAYENGQNAMGRYSRILMYGIVIITIIGGVLLYYSLKRRNG